MKYLLIFTYKISKKIILNYHDIEIIFIILNTKILLNTRIY